MSQPDDDNGNLLTLLRKSIISSAVTTIDDLTYSYKSGNNTNQLENITDNITTNTTGTATAILQIPTAPRLTIMMTTAT